MASIARCVSKLLLHRRLISGSALRFCASAVVSLGSPQWNSSTDESFLPGICAPNLASESPHICYLVGFNGLLVLDGKDFLDFDTYLDQRPFLTPIPSDRLFGNMFKPHKPYLLEDPIRRVLRSGGLASLAASHNGFSLINMFRPGNVGVHRRLGVIVFRDFSSDNLRPLHNPSLGLRQYSDYLKGRILQHHGSNALGALPEAADAYFEDLDRSDVIGELLLYHPTTIPDLLYADLAIEAYRIVVKECYAYGDEETAQRIVCAVGSHSENLTALTKVLGHGLLPQFLPRPLMRKYPAQMYPFNQGSIESLNPLQSGQVLFEVHRHGFIHTIEKQVLALVPKIFPKFSGKLDQEEAWEEVLTVIRHGFPNYLLQVYHAFNDEHKLPLLRVNERFPIPEIYFVKTIPTSFVVAFISYCDCGKY